MKKEIKRLLKAVSAAALGISLGACADSTPTVPDKTPEENAAAMEEEIARVKTGQLTYAVRDTHIDDKTICSGDIMGVGDHAILAVGKEIDAVAEETVAEIPEETEEVKTEETKVEETKTEETATKKE